MEKTLSLEIELCEGPKEKDTFVFSRVNEDIAGAGAGEKGTLAFLLSVKPLADQPVPSVAKDLASSFETSYLESKKGTVLASLEEALTNLKETAEGEQVYVELVASVVWGPILYIGKIGKGKIFLWRSGNVKEINFSFVASGQLRNGETICLANTPFGEKFDTEQLSLILGRDSLSDVKKKLDETLREEPGSLAVLIRVSLTEAALFAPQVDFVDTDKKQLLSPTAFSRKFSSKLKSFSEETWIKIAPVFEYVKSLFLKIFNRLAQPWRKRLPGEIHDERSRRRERLIQVGVALGILLVISISVSVWSARESSRKKTLTSLGQKIEEGIAGVKKASSTEQGSSYLSDLSILLEKAEKEGLPADELNKFQAEYDELLAANKHIYKTEKLSQVADLTKSSIKASKIAWADPNLVFLTTDGKKVYKIDPQSGKLTNLSSSLDAGLGITAEGNSVYVFGKDALWKLELEKTGLNKVLSSQTSWGEVLSLSVYNSNIYLLDKEKNEIWKYLASNAGLGSARNYFANPKPAFTDPVSLAVDGAAWVATKQGAVFKFVAGKRQDFHLSGSPENLAIDQMATDQKTKNLYLLDTENSRVVVFSKEGSYLASYQDPHLSAADSFVVNEETKTVWFVSGNKIYQFKLR